MWLIEDATKTAAVPDVNTGLWTHDTSAAHVQCPPVESNSFKQKSVL